MKHVMCHWFQFLRHRWAFTEFRSDDPREEPGLIRGTPKGVFWSEGRAIFQAQHPNEIIFWMILDDILGFHFLGTFLAVKNWQSIAWRWREITNSTLPVGFLDLKVLEDHSKQSKTFMAVISHTSRSRRDTWPLPTGGSRATAPSESTRSCATHGKAKRPWWTQPEVMKYFALSSGENHEL